MLGLGSSMMKHPVTGKSIVRDGLVLQHNYNLSSVEPLSSGAASFNGTNDEILASDVNDFGTDDFSITAWFKIDTSSSISGEVYFITKYEDGNNQVRIGYHYGNKKPVMTAKGGGNSIVGNSTPTALTSAVEDEWNHIAFTCDRNGKSTMYVNGNLEHGISVNSLNSTQSLDNTGAWVIGGAASITSGNFEGLLCNVGIWKGEALSQPQIKSIMNKNYDSLSASEKTNLVSWWNLDSVIPDSTTLVYDNHHGGEGEVLGVELVNCVGFDCVDPAAVWSEQAGWSFSGGKAIYDGTGGTSGLIQSNVIEVGKQYKVIVEVLSNQGSGSNTIYLGGTVLSSSHLSVGTHVFYGATSNTNVSLYIYGRSGEVFEIGSFSAKEINGNTGTLS